MKCGKNNKIIHKDVVVIGNGPSGLILSYLLSGNIPYVTSDNHPDEMLSARLRSVVGQSLLHQNLDYLSSGLEGRTTNEVSLLMDALLQPCADIGLELDPLVEFRKNGYEIDHVVLGKGPPGGSWHRMDPQILTLSLGSWMALPGLKFPYRDNGEKRAYASNVAKYYMEYSEKTGIKNNFANDIVVTSVEPLEKETNHITENNRKPKSIWAKTIDKGCLEICIEAESEDQHRTCFISNALNCLLAKSRKKRIRCKRQREDNTCLTIPTSDKKRSFSLCCDASKICDSFSTESFSISKTASASFKNNHNTVPYSRNFSNCDSNRNWLVNAVDLKTGEKVTYSCKYLVLANGSSDRPNRLECSKGKPDPDWLVYDLRSLEQKLDIYIKNRQSEDIDPVLVIGAGLSAADAVIAVRGKNVPVVHVFRSKLPDFSHQLPENLYPEYHKVHQMMLDGGTNYPLYTAYPEYNLTDFNSATRTVTLSSKNGHHMKINISFTVVLIGSRPDLSFLPPDFKVGLDKSSPVDCKMNTVNINRLSYEVSDYENLFAVGPLAGDNFVRFLPGGALAVVSELYKRYKFR